MTSAQIPEAGHLRFRVALVFMFFHENFKMIFFPFLSRYESFYRSEEKRGNYQQFVKYIRK